MSKFDWNKYFELATELSTREDEASLRSAVSRAYYFVYNTAKKREAVSHYRFKEEGQSHQELWDLYERNAPQGCKDLAVRARRLRGRRVEADYYAIYARLAEDVVFVMEDAMACKDILAALAPDYPKPVEKVKSF